MFFVHEKPTTLEAGDTLEFNLRDASFQILRGEKQLTTAAGQPSFAWTGLRGAFAGHNARFVADIMAGAIGCGTKVIHQTTFLVVIEIVRR